MPMPNTAEWLCRFLGNRKSESLNNIQSINWPKLFHLAQRHGVAPQLYYRLKASGLQDIVPLEIFQPLHQTYLRNVARNMRLYHELARILGLLNQHKIPVIILKGAYLAKAVYGNIALRTMADIDLLLKEADLQRAVKLLHDSGYTSDTTWLSTAHLPPFIKPGGIRIELHWTLEDPASPFTIDIAGLWERASATLIAKVPAYGLAREDLLLHSCLHLAFRHQFRIGLRALCDIGAILQSDRHELDWSTLVSRACQWKVERCVYLSLYYADDILAVDMPVLRLEAFRIPSPAPEFLMRIKKSILMDDNSRRISPNMVRLWSLDRFREQLTFFFGRVFLPPQKVAQLYAVSPWSFRVVLYYVKRLKTLSVRYGRLIWSFLRHDADIADSIAQQDSLLQWLIPPPQKQEKHQ